MIRIKIRILSNRINELGPEFSDPNFLTLGALENHLTQQGMSWKEKYCPMFDSNDP